MAITTYSELQTALSDRIAFSGFTAGQLQECIALAEAEMQRTLDTLDMVTQNASFSIASEYVSTPTGLLEVRDFYLNTDPKTILLSKSAGDLTNLYNTGSGKPKFYSIQGAQFRFGPVPDGTYTATLTYLAKFTPLDGVNTTNWLLTAHPDVYLHGSLKHAGIRLQDPDKTSGYATLFQAGLDAINRQAQKARWSGPGFYARADVVV